jgi:hypothetical protein
VSGRRSLVDWLLGRAPTPPETGNSGYEQAAALRGARRMAGRADIYCASVLDALAAEACGVDAEDSSSTRSIISR